MSTLVFAQRSCAILAACAGTTALAQQASSGPARQAESDACMIASQNSVGYQRHDCDLVGCGKQAMLRAALAAHQDALSERAAFAAAAGIVPLDAGGGGDAGGIASNLGITEAMGDTNVLNLALDLEINPNIDISITGTATYTIRIVNSGVNQFTVRLRNQYTITGLTLNGANWSTANASAPSSTTRVIALDRAYNAGETITLAISYTGLTVSRGFGSITFGTQNSVPIVSTLSEPYFAYTWWPAKDGDFGVPGDNSDKFPCQISITAPNPLRSVANGLPQGVDALSGNRSRYRWATNIPLTTYLAFFSTTNYTNYQLTWNYSNIDNQSGSMPVYFWMYPTSDTPSNRALWELSLPALTLYSQLYGLYPFVSEKYGVYQFPFSGGQEHQTFTGMGVFLDYVTVHELAHQWWGDNVTCRTWSDIWLNEGFADYSEGLWYERNAGGTNLAALQSAMAARRPGTGSGTVYVYPVDTANANRIFQTSTTYYKGGWVLHMLRHVIGDDTFFTTLKTYRGLYQGGTAVTDDFRAVAEMVSGKPLAAFFNEWVYGSGEVAYGFGFDNVTINGKNYVRMHVRQTQSASYGAGGKFTTPIDVRIAHAQGTLNTNVANNQTTQYYVIPAPAAASGVTLDPDAWILTSAKTPETLLVGPPKIVETSPAPGASVAFEAGTNTLNVFFSYNVNTTAANYTVSGPTGSVPFTLAYSALNQRATLNFAGPLAAGTYTVTVTSGVTNATGGAALDGEIANAGSAASLPSGDGVAGGNAVFTFTINAPACRLDYNQDGSLNPDDLGDFITDYFTVPAMAGPGGYAIACPGNPPPYDAGYRAGYTSDGSGQCGEPNPDNLGDFITDYFIGCAGF